jgi:SAM-dependent methyltransferase
MVVIANYGTTNDRYLHRLLKEYRSMPFRLDLHVLTNVSKTLGSDVQVHIGLPSRNPRSLPFAHRRLFAEHIGKADFFIYTEDDTLVTERNIRSFFEVNALLRPGEIPGFLRVEQSTNGERHVTTAHGPYRWDPGAVVERDGAFFANFTNSHSAFTMASREQVQRAINSGGFLVRPHVGRFAMLESAASDLYTQCGMARMICISRIEEFLIHHLPNNYHNVLGVPYKEVLEQTRALQRIAINGTWTGTLFPVETRMPKSWSSKNLYERPDPSILDCIPKTAKSVLAIGSGWGETEELLAKLGKQVVGIPIDAVFGDSLRRRGVEVVEGPFEECLDKLRIRRFDTVLMQDVIHLLPDPVRWLSGLRPLLSSEGVFVVSVPRTFDPLRCVYYSWAEPAFALPGRFLKSGVQKVTRSRLVKWFLSARLKPEVRPVCEAPARLRIREKLRGFGQYLVNDRFIVLARARPATPPAAPADRLPATSAVGRTGADGEN